MTDCPECGGKLKDAPIAHREKFGPFVVVDDTRRGPACTTCGWSSIDLETKQSYELRAAQVVLHQVAEIPGEVLRGVRKSLGLKQTELAELLDIRPETISRYESGEQPVPRTVQLAVADICRRVEQARGDIEAARPLSSAPRTLRVA